MRHFRPAKTPVWVTLDGTLGVISLGMSVASAAMDLATSTTEAAHRRRGDHDPRRTLAPLPRLRRLPDRIDRIMTLAARGDLRVRSVADEDGGRILRTLINRALLTAVGAAFLLVAAVLLVAADKGPAVSSGTGLFEILGYGSLFAGSVLLLRVVAAVARDGTT